MTNPFELGPSEDSGPSRRSGFSSGFHCPFCKQVVSTLNQVLSRCGEKVKLVFRDFPTVPIPRPARQPWPGAAPAIRESSGGITTRSSRTLPNLSPEQLKTYAKKVSLGPRRFERCLSRRDALGRGSTGRGRGDSSWRDRHAGILRERRVALGAQPLESFARLIERELARMR